MPAPGVPGFHVDDLVFAGQVVLVVVSAVEDHFAVVATQVKPCTLALAAVAHEVTVVGEHLGTDVAAVLLLPLQGDHLVTGHGVAATLAKLHCKAKPRL